MCSRRCAERSSLCIKSSSSAALKSHAFRRLTQLHHKACYCEVTLKILPIEQLVPYAEHVGSRLLRGYAVCIVAKPTRALAESKTGPCTLKAFRGHKVAATRAIALLPATLAAAATTIAAGRDAIIWRRPFPGPRYAAIEQPRDLLYAYACTCACACALALASSCACACACACFIWNVECACACECACAY